MDKNGKIWGFTSKIFAKNNVEVHRIEGKLGGKSSLHRHTAKWSMFFVERGHLKIHIEKNDYPLMDETILAPGETIVIKPNEYHSFEIYTANTVAYEIYWTELDSNDIERKNCGTI
jgi:mannose-6-phosphate isomerase-like protein (cupin superfamily)